MTTPPPIADQLREAIRASGRSLYELARASDVPVSSLHGFMNSGRDIRISTAQALADALGKKLNLK